MPGREPAVTQGERRMRYDKLRRMCIEKDVALSNVYKELNITGRTVIALANNKNVSLKTIDRLCTYFKCQPDEIMEFVQNPGSLSDHTAQSPILIS